MGNTDSKTLPKGPAGQHSQLLNNSQSHTSIKFILIILVVALIDLAVKLGLCKRKMASIGQQYMKQTNGGAHLTLIATENGRTNTFSSTDNPSSSSVGRLESPGPPPYGATKTVWNVILQRHEDSTNSQSRFNAEGTNIQGTSGPKLPNLRLQIRKAKQVAGSNPSPGQQATNTRPEPLPRSKSSRQNGA